MAAPASAALRCCVPPFNVKKCAVYGGAGLPVPSTWTVLQELDCYRQSRLYIDSNAYCHVMLKDPFRHGGAYVVKYRHDPEADRWLLLCHRTNLSHLDFDARHPAGATGQIHSAVVSNGSQWCPNSAAEGFRPAVGNANKVTPNHVPDLHARRLLQADPDTRDRCLDCLGVFKLESRITTGDGAA